MKTLCVTGACSQPHSSEPDLLPTTSGNATSVHCLSKHGAASKDVRPSGCVYLPTTLQSPLQTCGSNGNHSKGRDEQVLVEKCQTKQTHVSSYHHLQLVRPHGDVYHTQRNWSGAQWSYLGLCPGSAGITGKLPPLPGLDPLVVRRPVSHWVGQVRHRLPCILPHLERHPTLVVGHGQGLQNPRGLPHRLHRYRSVHHRLHSRGFTVSTGLEEMSRNERRGGS